MAEDEFNPRRDLFRRYGRAFRAAWRERKSTRRSRRYTAAEADFLPASLTVSERPTPIMPHVALWSVCGLVVFAVLWSMFGRMDIVVVASGKVLASGKTKVIQSVEPQVVRAIPVSEGQTVAEGDLLIQFDPTSAEADIKRYGAEIERATAQQWMYGVLLDNIGDEPRSTPLALTRPAPAAVTPSNRAALAARWDEYRAKVDKATADLARRRAERRALEIVIASGKERVANLSRRESDYRMMVLSQAAPRHSLHEQEIRTVEARSDLDRSVAQIQQLDLGVVEAEATLALTHATDKAAWRERLNDAEREASAATAERDKAAYRLSINSIRAPVAGRVQQLTITAPGAVASSGQAIMSLVPHGDAHEIEALVENRDIGFIRVGQRAEVKLEPFDYTRFGVLPAEVVVISPDSVADERGVLRFPVRLRLEKSVIRVGDLTIPVSPGMGATADIKSGRRTILSYLLSPILQTVQESLRER